MINCDGDLAVADSITTMPVSQNAYSPQEMEKRWMALTTVLGIKLAALSHKEANALARDIYQRYFV